MELRSREIALTLILSFTGTFQASAGGSFAEPDPPKLTVNTLARTCKTPQALVRFLRQEITFQQDMLLFGKPDHWQSPEEFLDRRAGDCEDYAILTQAVLAQQGKEAFVLSLYGPKGYAHTVCVFVEKGRYNIVNQNRVILYQAESLEALAALLHPEWTWGAVAERTGHRGRPLFKIRRFKP